MAFDEKDITLGEDLRDTCGTKMRKAKIHVPVVINEKRQQQ
jgi:hypothetical protein